MLYQSVFKYTFSILDLLSKGLSKDLVLALANVIEHDSEVNSSELFSFQVANRAQAIDEFKCTTI